MFLKFVYDRLQVRVAFGQLSEGLIEAEAGAQVHFCLRQIT